MMKKGLVIIGHGSRSKDAVDAFFQVVEIVRSKGDFEIVEGAFMELSAPPIPEVVAKVVGTGVKEVILVPYFLYEGIHIKEDIPQLIEEISKKYSGIKLKLARPIGVESVLADILLARAKAIE